MVSFNWIHFRISRSRKKTIHSCENLDKMQGYPLSDIARILNCCFFAQYSFTLEQKSVSKLIGIGEKIIAAAGCFAFLKRKIISFPVRTDAFSNQLHGVNFHNETIRIKGGRLFRFE